MPDPTPLVPPTPPTTADAADFEYPLGMPYTLTQWRQAGDALTLRWLRLLSITIHLAAGGIFIAFIATQVPNIDRSDMLFAGVGVVLVLRGLIMLALPHPGHVAFDGAVLCLLGVGLAVMPWVFVWRTLTMLHGMPGGTPSPLIGPFGVFVIFTILQAFTAVSAGIWLLRTARQLAYLAGITVSPELLHDLRRRQTTLVIACQKKCAGVVTLTTNAYTMRWTHALHLLDGYAFVLAQLSEMRLLRCDEVEILAETAGRHPRVTLNLAGRRVGGWMTHEHLHRLRTWKGETDD